jgi:predicted glycosyltransferase
MLEEHEEDIEEWFFNHKADNINKDKSSSSLEKYLCRQGRMLKTKSDQKCLDEVDKNSKKKKKKTKGETADSEKADVKHTEL